MGSIFCPQTDWGIVSAEAQTYVERYSPYSGVTYQVHLRLGLLSNDAHGHQIYCGDKYLMDKCRASERSIKRAKAQLVKDGFLKIISPAVGRRPAVYEFLFRGVEIGGHDGPLSRIGGQMSQNRGPNLQTTPIYIKKYKRSETEVSESSLSVPMPAGFKESLRMN